jgi:hypothetical protein
MNRSFAVAQRRRRDRVYLEPFSTRRPDLCLTGCAASANAVPRNRTQNDETPRLRGFNEWTGATGLEPATSGVTGRRSNQLSYAPELASRPQRRIVAGPTPPR